MNRWKTSKTAVYNLSYHLIWCPKYRRSVLTDGVEEKLEELLYLKAQQINIEIIEANIMPDHVHLFIKAGPNLAPQFVVNQLKGYTSRLLRQLFPKLKSRLPTLWTRSYYIDSVGKLNEYTIRKYVQNQKNK